jgi:hypothetical protein
MIEKKSNTENLRDEIESPVGTVTILSIRNFILDRGLSERDAVSLNTINFDDIVLEYRKTYNQSIPLPFYLLGVLITEGELKKTSFNIIKASRDDYRRYEGDHLPFKSNEILFSDLTYSDKHIFRCGWCGNVVDSNGYEFDAITKTRTIEILKKFEKMIKMTKVNGKCCPDGPNS